MSRRQERGAQAAGLSPPALRGSAGRELGRRRAVGTGDGAQPHRLRGRGLRLSPRVRRWSGRASALAAGVDVIVNGFRLSERDNQDVIRAHRPTR
jgi:hypothetical protein